jgi:hypothetical protein
MIGPSTEKLLETDDISALFGLELAEGDAPGAIRARDGGKSPMSVQAPDKSVPKRKLAGRRRGA